MAGKFEWLVLCNGDDVVKEWFLLLEGIFATISFFFSFLKAKYILPTLKIWASRSVIHCQTGPVYILLPAKKQ